MYHWKFSGNRSYYQFCENCLNIGSLVVVLLQNRLETSIIKKILPRVNLNGTWFGEYESYKSHDKKKEVSSGGISVRIKQDYLNIGLNSFTEQSHHSSYSEELTYDEKNDIHGIVYVYSQKENSIFDTAKRNGTSELTLKNINNEHWLEGDFWTGHGTQGKIKVKQISKKHIDTFDETKSLVK